jgi:deoxyribonuclease V
MNQTGRRNLKPNTSNGSISQWKMSRWRAVQRKLAQRVIRQDSFSKPLKLVAGIDVAYNQERAFSATVVMRYETLEIVESEATKSTVENPYIPSFLAFRELKPMTKAIKRLKTKPDVFLVNAHGIAHPERCGCASHLGVVLDVPTIGVASTVLHGEVSDQDKIGTRYLKDEEEIIGAVIAPKVGGKPVYVSIGHRVSLDSAIEIIYKSTKGNRMPEPLRLAHRLSNETKIATR